MKATSQWILFTILTLSLKSVFSMIPAAQPQPKVNFYKVLDVERDASTEEISRAFREKKEAVTETEDVNGTILEQLEEALENLRSQISRITHDQELDTAILISSDNQRFPVDKRFIASRSETIKLMLEDVDTPETPINLNNIPGDTLDILLKQDLIAALKEAPDQQLKELFNAANYLNMERYLRQIAQHVRRRIFTKEYSLNAFPNERRDIPIAPRAAQSYGLSHYFIFHPAWSKVFRTTLTNVLATGEKLETEELTSHDKPVNLMKLSGNGRSLAIIFDDNTLTMIDIRSKTVTQQIIPCAVKDIHLSARGNTLVLLCDDNTLRQWSVSEGKEVPPTLRLVQNPYSLFSFLPTPDKNIYSFSTVESTLRNYEDIYVTSLKEQKSTKIFRFSQQNVLNSWAISPTGTYLALGTKEYRPLVYDRYGINVFQGEAQTQLCIYHIPTNASFATCPNLGSKSILSIAWSPDSTLVAAGLYDGTINIIEASTQKVIMKLMGNNQPITALSWSPNGSFIVAGTTLGSLIFWDRTQKEPLYTQPFSESSITQLLWYPDGDHLIVGDAQGYVSWVTVLEPLTLEQMQLLAYLTDLQGEEKGLIFGWGARTITKKDLPEQLQALFNSLPDFLQVPYE